MKTPGDSGKFVLLCLLFKPSLFFSYLLAVILVGKANRDCVADLLTS